MVLPMSDAVTKEYVDNNAMVLTREQASEMYSQMLHVEANVVEEFKYSPWMEAIARIYIQNCGPDYVIHDATNYRWLAAKDLFDEVIQVYIKGLAGDLEAVDRFVGGYELAQDLDLVIALESTQKLSFGPGESTGFYYNKSGEITVAVNGTAVFVCKS